MIENRTLASNAEEHHAALHIAPLSGESDFRADSEEALAERFSRTARPIQQDLVFEFTRDAGLLHQYYCIREQQFRSVLNAPRYSGAETEDDRRGNILIARQRNFCIGGTRLVIKTPRKPDLLPLEINGFRITPYFPQLETKQMCYGQISALSLLPEFRGGAITRKLGMHLYRKIVLSNLDMVFAYAPIKNARLYQQICTEMGLKNVVIHMDIELPQYPGVEEVKWYLMSGVVDKTLISRNTEFSKISFMDNQCAEA